jgi:CDP-paratose 2-epimerase
LLELLSLIESLGIDKPKVNYHDWRPADQKVYVSDIRKASRLLAWDPKVQPREGVARLARWIFAMHSVELPPALRAAR